MGDSRHGHPPAQPAAMAHLPRGTVTFFFTDIEGSTKLLAALGERYTDVVEGSRRILRSVLARHGGQEVDTPGDAFFAAFPRAHAALAAAVEAQREFATQTWPAGVSVRVRVGLHTGEPLVTASGYVGMDVHRAARICQAAHGRQILLSQTTADLIADDLPPDVTLRDLGPHRLKDLTHPQRLYQALAADLPGEFLPPRTLEAFPHNLPVQLTSFVGREREMREIIDRLSHLRLLTIIGAGGSGKTRLALQVAADRLEDFPDGIGWVDLAPLTDAAFVAQAVASVLHVREQAGIPLLDSLVDYLRPRTLLLILDNCEHLLTACAELTDGLLHRCAHLRVLATSREALTISGEGLYPLPTLSLPDAARLPALESLATYESVRLFVDRAGAVVPAFRLTAGNAAAVAQICTRLDGIPLAVELAAARVTALSPEQIAARLDDQFRLLTGGSRTALPRHQTLQATMDWSAQLLSEAERAMFRRLSVFAGGFTLAAAESVATGPSIAPAAGLDVLAQLVGKSLVVAETTGAEIRYRLLEPIRQYARDRLRETLESESTRDRHLQWYLALAEQSAPRLRRHGQVELLRALDAEHENMRAAFEWSVAADQPEAALRLAGALFEFWELRAYFTEGRRRLAAALDRRGDAVPPAIVAKTLAGAASLAQDQADYDSVLAFGTEALELYRTTGDRRGEAYALHLIGAQARWRAQFDGAAALYHESLALYQEARDDWGIASGYYALGALARARKRYDESVGLLTRALDLYRQVGDTASTAQTLYLLGLVARAQGRFDQGRAFAEESLALAGELDEDYTVAHAQHLLGQIAWYQGDNDRAAALHEQSLALFQEIGDKSCTATTLTDLGLVAMVRGDLDRAVAFHRDGLARRWALGDKAGVADCLERLAEAVRQRGQMPAAAKLLGAAQALRDAIGVPRAPVDERPYTALFDAVQATLGPDAFAAARNAGGVLPLPDAVEFALRDV